MAGGPSLQHDPVALEERLPGTRRHGRGGAVDEHRVGEDVDGPPVEHHAAGLQRPDPPEAHHPVQPAEHLQWPPGAPCRSTTVTCAAVSLRIVSANANPVAPLPMTRSSVSICRTVMSEMRQPRLAHAQECLDAATLPAADALAVSGRPLRARTGVRASSTVPGRVPRKSGRRPSSLPGDRSCPTPSPSACWSCAPRPQACSPSSRRPSRSGSGSPRPSCSSSRQRVPCASSPRSTSRATGPSSGW